MSNYVDEGQNAFEAAITYIQKIIDLYPQNSQFLLLTNDFAPYSNSPKSKNEIEELITEINLTGISRTIEEIMLRINTLSTMGRTNDVYWLSDFQKSTVGELSQLTSDTTFNNFILPLIYNNALNVYVDSLYLSNPFLIHSEKNKLNVVLRNDSDDYIEDLLIKLSINNIQTANGSLSIDPYSTALITFDLNMKLDKFNFGSVSFEDFPVTFDNDFYFTLTLSDKIFIAELKDTDSTTVIEKVFGNQNLFNFQSYNISNIDYNDLLKSDLIILNELDNLEITISNILNDFLNQKGDVIFIPSAQFDVSSFLSISGPIKSIPDSIRTTISIDNLDLNNPFFTDIFEDHENTFNMPSAKPVINIQRSNESIMKLKDGSDFLSYQQLKNRLYVLASPLRSDYTDFYTHAIFVPIMYRIAMLSKKEFNRIYYTLDESVIKVTTDSINSESIIKLKSKDKEIVPGARIAGSDLILDIPKFELNPAHYNIEIENVIKGSIAFNPDKSESLLEQHTIENLRDLSSENSYVKLFNIKGFDNFDKEIKEKYLGIPLWRITLILTLIFLLIEIILIRFL